MSTENKTEILSSYIGNTLPEEFDSELIYAMYSLSYKNVTYYEQLSEFINDTDNLYGFAESDIKEYNDSTNKSGILKTFNMRLKGGINSIEDVHTAFSYALANPEEQSYNSGGGTSSSGGSKSGSVGGGTYVPIVIPGADAEDNPVPDEEYVDAFNDLDKSHWAYNAVMLLRKEGIIDGMSDNIFAPNDNVTREQFVKMLTLGLRMTGVEAEVEFSDVKESDWFYNAVGAAVRAGIVNGISETEFGVGMAITREQAAVMVKRAADNRSISLTSRDVPEFSDMESVSDYAQDAVKISCVMGDYKRG